MSQSWCCDMAWRKAPILREPTPAEPFSATRANRRGSEPRRRPRAKRRVRGNGGPWVSGVGVGGGVGVGEGGVANLIVAGWIFGRNPRQCGRVPTRYSSLRNANMSRRPEICAFPLSSLRLIFPAETTASKWGEHANPPLLCPRPGERLGSRLRRFRHRRGRKVLRRGAGSVGGGRQSLCRGRWG